MENYSDFVASLVKSGDKIIATLSPQKMHFLHMCVGVAGEGGEILDAAKKHIIYNKELDLDNIIEELGDIEFYAQAIRDYIGVTREQVLEANVSKLSKRYSGAYSDQQAIDRSDKENERN